MFKITDGHKASRRYMYTDEHAPLTQNLPWLLPDDFWWQLQQTVFIASRACHTKRALCWPTHAGQLNKTGHNLTRTNNENEHYLTKKKNENEWYCSLCDGLGFREWTGAPWAVKSRTRHLSLAVNHKWTGTNVIDSCVGLPITDFYTSLLVVLQ